MIDITQMKKQMECKMNLIWKPPVHQNESELFSLIFIPNEIGNDRSITLSLTCVEDELVSV